MLVIMKILGPHMSTDLKGRDNGSGCPHLSPRMSYFDLLVSILGHRITGKLCINKGLRAHCKHRNLVLEVAHVLSISRVKSDMLYELLFGV